MLQSTYFLSPATASSKQHEYSSMSHSVFAPPFLYRSFVISPTLTPAWSTTSLTPCDCHDPAAEARTGLLAFPALCGCCSLQWVKKKRCPVLGSGQNRRARSPGSQP
jgi:hypothetical protein